MAQILYRFIVTPLITLGNDRLNSTKPHVLDSGQPKTNDGRLVTIRFYREACLTAIYIRG